jgi:apolipoprotein N-acyltransferase
MQELPSGEAPSPARGQEPHVLSRLRLSTPGAEAGEAGLPLPISLGLSALSGLLLSLALPPADLGPLAFVSMVPFLWVLSRSSHWRGLLAGFAFGFAIFASTLYWIRLFGWLAWGSLSLASAAYPGLFGLLAPLLARGRRPVRFAVGLAALWTGIEYLRGMWPLGGFTWGGVGYTQANNGFLLPLASWTGVWGVSFVVVLVNALVLLAMERAGRRRAVASGRAGAFERAVAAGLAGVALAAVLLPGLIRIPAPDGRRLDVAIVQGNDFEHELADPFREDVLIARNYARLDRTLASHPPDLSVWPESAVDEDPRAHPQFGRLVTGAVRAVGVPTLVGASTGPPGGRQYRQSLLYDGRGRVVGVYTKVHLVPFGEYVPWRRYLDWISALKQVPYDVTPGRHTRLLSLDGVRFANVICFENTFPSLVRRLVDGGGGFLVVTTNNASYGRSAASRQHLLMSRFRAVENGRWVVHAAISGISAFIDPHGGVHGATGLFRLAVDRDVIRASTALTIYTRFGDYFPWASLGLAGLMMVGGPGRRRGLRLQPQPRLQPRIRLQPQAVAPLPVGVRILIIVPTYNERRTIGTVIERTLATDGRVEMLVVDDGSPDGTGEVVGSIAEGEPRVRLMERPRKGGLASAYMAGFRRAIDGGYGLVVEMDADLSHQPEELPALLAAAERLDLVIGSRYVPGGSVTNWGLLRRALSRGGNLYTRAMLGLPVADATSGYRVFRRGLIDFLLEEGIHSEGYGFQIELAYRAWLGGFAVGEVPITFREREHGHSKISRRIVFEALGLVALWALRDRLRLKQGRPGRAAPPKLEPPPMPEAPADPEPARKPETPAEPKATPSETRPAHGVESLEPEEPPVGPITRS